MGDDDIEEDPIPRPTVEPHFARACPVETHVQISQEPLCTEIYTKNAAAQIEPRTQTQPAQSKCTSTFHKRHPKSHFLQKFKNAVAQIFNKSQETSEEPLYTEI